MSSDNVAVPAMRLTRLLDRIEHRQADVGLRFWDSPLWLEVTMTGPDSDPWPAVSVPSTWDWQSDTVCAQAGDLQDAEVDEDRVLEAIGRYTIENLILNAVHEIGEWLRADGRRVFPPHLPTASDTGTSHDQGNGPVTIQLRFGRGAGHADAEPPRDLGPLPHDTASTRYTYLPSTTIRCEAPGPVIARWTTTGLSTCWRSSWSDSTLEAVRTRTSDLVTLIDRDVHRMLVMYETDRICRAFHIDGRRPWRLASAESPVTERRLPGDPPAAEPLAVSVLYAGTGQAGDEASPASGP